MISYQWLNQIFNPFIIIMAHDCSKLSSVAVYCGSQKGKRPEYEQHAIGQYDWYDMMSH